jgi:glycosyltransferase involved in cell wall biosynthesis
VDPVPSAPAVPLVSIVVPVYGEACNLQRLLEELTRVTRLVSGTEFEIIFVNDGSPDDSLLVLTRIAEKRPDCKIVDLSRNFGKEIALSAGVHYASGDAVICIDADLQHPPSLIPAMLQAWRQGAEVVLTVRRSSARKALARRLGGRVYYWLMSRIADRKVVVSNGTDYRLISRSVIEAFNQIGERDRMFRGLVDWLGFERVQLEFDAPAREQGEPGYTYARLFRLAVSSLVAHSLLPLRFVGYLGAAITAASAFLLAWMLVAPLFSPARWVYTPLAKVVVGNTLLIGIVLTALGVMSLYIAKIYAEVLDRPLYAVRQLVNFSIERVRLVAQANGGGKDSTRSRASGP